MNEKPLVSILLLSMNHELFIEKCINSLKEQTYKNIEIIYLDNASSDNTFEIGKELLEKSNISHKIFLNKESKGISKNLNFLYGHCAGNYFIPLSSDDWLTPNSIEEKVNYFEQHPEYGMVYSSCYYYYFDTEEKIICPRKSDYKEGWVLEEILRGNFIRSVGSMIKRETIETIGLFDEDSLLEDWEMWIRIAEKYPFGFVNKELGYYGKKNGANITENYKYMLGGFEYIIDKYSHYKEIQVAKKEIIDSKCYILATKEPSLKTLKFILKNYRFNYFYFKQIGKTILGLCRNTLFV
jgi:glycosyltransferase involved in cell wall biosynthesis